MLVSVIKLQVNVYLKIRFDVRWIEELIQKILII
jgi:hypothetical protein